MVSEWGTRSLWSINAQAAIAKYSDVVREYLPIPESRHVVCAISFGYADNENTVNQFRTERASIDEAVRPARLLTPPSHGCRGRH